MLNVLKSSFVIVVLVALTGAVLAMVTRRNLRGTITRSGIATAGSFISLAAPTFYIAAVGLALVSALTSRSAKQIGAIMIFVLMVVPSFQLLTAAASTQLIPLSPELAVIVGVAVAFIGLAMPRAYRLRLRTDWPALFIIVLTVFAASRGTSFTNFGRVTLAVALSYALPYILLRRSLSSRQAIDHAMLALSYAAIAVAVLAVFECVRGWPLYEIYKPHFGVFAVTGAKMRYGFLRAGGPLTNPPETAFILSVLFFALVASRHLFQSKLIYMGSAVVVIAGLLATQSRTAWVGLAAGSLAMVAMRRIGKGLTLLLPLGTAALVTGLLITQSNARFSAMLGLSSDAIGSNEYRRQLQDRGFEVALQHPLIGQSSEAVLRDMAMLRQGEGIVDFTNGYLAIALQAGLTGAVLFLLALCWQTRTAIVTSRLPAWRDMGAAGQFAPVATVAIAAMFPFSPLDYRLVLIALIAMAIGNQQGLPAPTADAPSRPPEPKPAARFRRSLRPATS